MQKDLELNRTRTTMSDEEERKSQASGDSDAESADLEVAPKTAKKTKRRLKRPTASHASVLSSVSKRSGAQLARVWKNAASNPLYSKIGKDGKRRRTHVISRGAIKIAAAGAAGLAKHQVSADLRASSADELTNDEAKVFQRSDLSLCFDSGVQPLLFHAMSSFVQQHVGLALQTALDQRPLKGDKKVRRISERDARLALDAIHTRVAMATSLVPASSQLLSLE